MEHFALHVGRVLVTGGSGCVGHHLVAALAQKAGADIRVMARSPQRAREALRGCEVEIVAGDLTAPGTFSEACRGVGTVFHAAAAMPGQVQAPSTRAEFEQLNLVATLNLARAAAAAGARRFVFVSSTATMGTPMEPLVDEATACRPASPYEVSKRAAEEGLLALHEETGLEVAILRPCLIAGAGQQGGVLLKLFRLCRRGLFPVFGDRLDVQKPLVAVEDVVQALLLAAAPGRPSGLWLVTSGERHTLREMLAITGRLVGNPRPYRAIPLGLARLAASVTTPLARAAGRDPPLSPERLDLFVADRAIDISRARTELGYRPEHTALEPMLDRTYSWYVTSGQL